MRRHPHSLGALVGASPPRAGDGVSSSTPSRQSDYILLPDVAHPVAPLVRVQGAHRAAGSGTLYFVDVIERRASTLESLFPSLHPHGTLEPASAHRSARDERAQAEEAELQEMSFSQRVAAAVALRRLGYHVVAKPTGVVVAQLIAWERTPPGNLQPTDVIVSVDGTPTPTIAKLRTGLPACARRATRSRSASAAVARTLDGPDPDDRRPG